MMLEKGKISARQYTVLVILYTIGTSILIVPSSLATVAKQDGWIASILGIGAGLLSVLLYHALGNRFPNMTLAEYSERILGKWLGKTVSLLFISFIFLLASFLLRVVGNFMTTHIMPETPIEVVHIVFISVVILAVRLGLENIGRASEIFLPWVIILFLLLVGFLSPKIKIDNIQPVLEGGIKPVVLAAFYFFSLQELVVFLMLFPYVNRTKKARNAFLAGTWIGGIFVIITTVMSTLVLGTDFTVRNMYPSYTLAKQINVGNFLQRAEAILAVIWLITIFFKLAVCFYVIALGLAQTLKLKDYRPAPFNIMRKSSLLRRRIERKRASF
ncbi:GerAB/ArcD/ProY family transporter [Paenibacillus sp. Soil787]|uniref:GerAB/ArcD/ProY family transporter n=1 Tax=Paenibacillus sp. Soil787 TaxID=1736411 RepID=UPI001F36DE69|nr:endospore germination permease [Paenibacillus sp. Soil787]